MNEALKFYKGLEKELPNTAFIEVGAIYHCMDTGNTYLGVYNSTTSTNELQRFSTTVGQKKPNNECGEIFNDYRNNLALGRYSHAEGLHTMTHGEASHAEGYQSFINFQVTRVVKSYEYNPSDNTIITFTLYQPYPGDSDIIYLEYQINDEWKRTAINSYMNTLPYSTIFYAQLSETIDLSQATSINLIFTYTNPKGSHVEGVETIAVGEGTHAEGYQTEVEGQYGHAEGWLSAADGYAAHAEGYAAIASGMGSHSEGSTTQAIGAFSHAEGYDTIAYDVGSHTEGAATIAKGYASHAEGYYSAAHHNYTHAEGQYNRIAIDLTLENEATNTYAYALTILQESEPPHVYMPWSYEMLIDNENNIYRIASLSITDTVETSYSIKVYGQIQLYSSLPFSNSTYYLQRGGAFGKGSHSEGYMTCANGTYSHAEGSHTCAQYIGSHAEGDCSVALGDCAHSEGQSTIAQGVASHAEGFHTIADGSYQHVQGKYNVVDSDQAFIIGNGRLEPDNNNQPVEKRSNAMTVDWNGNAWFAGRVQSTAMVVQENIGYGTEDQMRSIYNPTPGQIFYVLTE